MNKLTQEALNVLGDLALDGHEVRITNGQLDRKLYLEVNEALEAIGGKWNRKAKAHIFADDPEDALDQILLSGGFIDEKKTFQFFETPDALADQLVAAAQIKDGMRVLEPSAGSGQIVKAILRAAPRALITTVEIQHKLSDQLDMLLSGHWRGLHEKFQSIKTNERHLDQPHAFKPIDFDYEIYDGDYMTFSTYHGRPAFERITMNPPFTKQQDIDHVTRAIGQLVPGGRLAAIMSPGFTFRKDRKTEDFKRLLDRHYAEVTKLPPGSFKSSGTNVEAVMVTAIGVA